MAVIGIFTDIGIEKSREAQLNEGFKIFPESFSVSNVASPSLDPAITAPNVGEFYVGSISAYIPISTDTVQINCVIPPSQTAALETIREIYVYAKDISNNDFLLAIGQPEVTSTIIYDPTGETTLRLQFTLVGADLTSLFEFAFTQATEISQHNLDINAHPVIQDAIKKAGIFPQPIQHKYIGQHFDPFPVFQAGVVDNDLVYKDTDNVYKKAIYVEGSITSKVAGVADVTSGCVYVEGLIDVDHAYTHGSNLFLSSVSAGQFSTVPSGAPLGHALDDEVVAFRVDSKNTVDSIFDAVVSDEVGYKHYTTYEDAISATPDGGWIRIDKTQALRGTDPLGFDGKRLNLVHTGTDTGLEVFGGVNEIQRLDFNPPTPDAGKYILRHDGNVTGDIPFGTDAATLEGILEGLASISDVSVSGDTTNGFVIEFSGVDGLQPQLEIDFPTDIGIDEVQRINFSTDDFNGGSFELEFNGSNTNAIAFNSIDAFTIENELNGLPTINSVTVVEEGSPPVGQKEFIITFTGVDGKQPQIQITAPPGDNSLVDSGASPITITESTDIEGVLPDNTLTAASAPVSLVPSTTVQGEIPGSLTAMRFEQPGTQVIGLGRLKNFNLGIDFNGQDETRVEMLFDTIVTPIDTTGLSELLDYNVHGSIGIQDLTVDDATLFRELVRVDPQLAPSSVTDVTPAEIVAGDGSTWGYTVDQFVSTYPGGTIDFATGTLTGGGDNFVPYTPTAAGNYFKYGVGLTINSNLRIVLPSDDAATPTGASDPVFENIVARAIVTVKDNGAGGSGTIDNILASNIKRFFTNSVATKVVKSEEHITVAPNEDTFNVTTFEWSTEHSVIDIEVYQNGNKLTQSLDGVNDKDFVKLDKDTIQLSYQIPVTDTRIEIIYIGNAAGQSTAGTGLVRKYKEIANGATTDFSPVLSDPLFTWTLSNDTHDIDVYVNGMKQDQGPGNDYIKLTSNTIQFLYTPSNLSKVEIFSKPSGGSVSAAGSLVTQDEGAVIESNTLKYNFIGNAVAAVQTSPGEVDVTITGELNTVSNEGTGVGEVFIQKTGQNFELRNVIAGTGIQVSLDGNNNIVISLAQSIFFRADEDAFTGLGVNTPNIYDPSTNKLCVFRNGLRMWISTTIGAASQRYLESTPSTITLFDAAVASDVFSFLNVTTPASFVQLVDSQVGTVINCNTYTLGTERLRVWRNGVLMNSAGLGSPSSRYAETSVNTITLVQSAVASDVFLFEHAPAAPNFVEHVTGAAGTTVSLSVNSYTLGTGKLVVYRNGVLVNKSTDLTLGPVASRYQEDTTTSITLEAPGSVITDVWTFIELP